MQFNALQYNTCIASNTIQYNIITDGKFIKLGSSYYTCALYNMRVVEKQPSAKVSNRVYDILLSKFMENTIPITKQIKSPSKIKAQYLLEKFDQERKYISKIQHKKYFIFSVLPLCTNKMRYIRQHCLSARISVRLYCCMLL